MEITKEIIELAKKDHYTTRELYDLAHAFELTHPDNPMDALKERLKKGRTGQAFGKRFQELVTARHRVISLIQMLGGPEGELQTLYNVIGELEPKAREAEAKRRDARAKENAARAKE